MDVKESEGKIYEKDDIKWEGVEWASGNFFKNGIASGMDEITSEM